MIDAEVTELIERIKSGDDRAFELLAEKYRPLLTSVASSFESTAKDEGIYGIFADLYQELTFALFRAAKSYDTEQDKVTFGNYAKRCAENCAISYLRKHRSLKRREQKVKNSLKKEQKAFSIFPESAAEDKLSLLESVRDALSDYEFHIFSKYLDGMKVSDIARSTGNSAKSVSNALFRCRSKVIKRYRKTDSK